MTNKEIVIAAFDAVFNQRDLSAIERYWGDPYIQHSPHSLNGRDNLKRLLGSMDSDFVYEVGLVLQDGDFVVIHARLHGVAPKPMIAIDILRLEDGKIVEHWDVVQEEITETASGNPMFPARA